MFNKTRSNIYPAIHLKRQPPIDAASNQVPPFFEQVQQDLKAVDLFKYNNVNVTPEGIVFRQFKIDKDLLIYPGHDKKYNFLYLASTRVKRKCVRLSRKEKYLLCVDYWSNSVFHWMCDALPRLQAVKSLAKDCILILPEFYTMPYILDTLKAFGVKDILHLKDNEYLHCEELYVPEQITVSGQMRPDNIRALRASLLQYFMPGFNAAKGRPNVYISRSKARFRTVLNEAELLPLLEKYNYQVIHFEDLDVAAQVELCYHAKNIVSIHGANLTNSIFMQPGGSVLELRRRGDLYNNYYYELADSAGCRYLCLDCDYEDPEPTKNTFSLYVDKALFEQALQKLADAT